MNRKTLLAAIACALLAIIMLGCGQTNDLQSIQLSGSNVSAAAPGTLDLIGAGGTQQIYLWGNYSDGKQKLLNAVGDVAYQISVTPNMPETSELAAPPQTVTLSANGLLTAVPPFVCTWVNSAVPPATSPAWAIGGTYTITATYAGFTSPPVFVAIASAGGGFDDGTNPTGECGPQPTS